jgi:hypothetical protein
MARARPFSELPKILDRIGKQVSIGTAALFKATAVAAGQAAILATPVDTGRARSNWIASVNTTNTDTRKPYAPGRKLGKGETSNARRALQQVVRTTKSFKIKTDKRIYIQNNLDYIGILNDGRSGSPPHNMLAKAEQAARQVPRKIKVLKDRKIRS